MKEIIEHIWCALVIVFKYTLPNNIYN
ncbi:unnamed protein product [Spirodela intermedia]|uniref:Uncharacterized protein n=1 Tax=Spirodela intermedia TaxID=51605 RepID=A0A7I8KF98_SPIIN|nr:unnamed protein product [Spirodela intermedia]